MKVSFIIPVYNAAPHLPRLIESLKAQKHADWEALFADDESEDVSLQILFAASKEDERIKVIKMKHSGQSVARNKCLEAACGDIVAFVNSDDIISEHILEAILPFFEDSKVDIVFFDFFQIEAAKASSFVFPLHDKNSEVSEISNPFKWALNKWNPYGHAIWRAIWRKSAINDIRFYPGIKYEDILFSYQVWRCVRKCKYVHERLYGYVLNPNSVTHSSFDEDKIHANFLILKELSDHYSKDLSLSQLIKHLLFPHIIKETWKQTSRQDNGAYLATIIDSYIYCSIKAGIIGFCGYTPSKMFKLALCYIRGWLRHGGFDIAGRIKKIFYRLKHKKIDYSRLLDVPWQRSSETIEHPVTIIIPVYNGYDAIMRLAATLFKHTATMHSIVFVNDASPDERIAPLLERFAMENSNVRVLTNQRNLGFAATVNRAVEESRNDFVLLNTDTEVPDNWIPRLFAPIWRDHTTASVTPTTCESHLIGVPTPETGTVQFVEKHGVDAIDKAVSRIKPDLEKDILVEGVGFCLAISRKAWDKVGPFAAEVFGRGYGEESDWCLRAHYKYSYTNRFASNLFVAHWHNGSFTKAETITLKQQNAVKLKARNPRFGNDRYLQALAKRGRKELWLLAEKACEQCGMIYGSHNPIVIISVIRDFPLYNQLVRDNRNNVGAEFVAFDNRKDNCTIPVRYNSFLDGYDYSKNKWLIFCHEDFGFLESISQTTLSKFDDSSIYGVIGSKKGKLIGFQLNSNRDGTSLRYIGSPIKRICECDTLDCQFMLIHSSLIAKFKLRFDERLSYDLYVEDFCITAKSKYNIRSYVFPFSCWHHSFGIVGSRYFNQRQYLIKKYKTISHSYTNTCGSFFGRHEQKEAIDRLKFCKSPIRRILRSFFKTSRTRQYSFYIRVYGIKIFAWLPHSFSKYINNPRNKEKLSVNIESQGTNIACYGHTQTQE